MQAFRDTDDGPRIELQYGFEVGELMVVVDAVEPKGVRGRVGKLVARRSLSKVDTSPDTWSGHSPKIIQGMAAEVITGALVDAKRGDGASHVVAASLMGGTALEADLYGLVEIVAMADVAA